MCRFVAYVGRPLLISQLVTEPVHSLIHQSYHALERPEPLNGDGFGVAWYCPGCQQEPALFREITPAWSNENLRSIARVTTSGCILAHVRAASPGTGVHYLNCHPFAIEHLTFMHNGSLAGFRDWKRRLINLLSEDAFAAIRGSTDSEHAFALFWDLYRRCRGAAWERLCEGALATIAELERLRLDAGIEDSSFMNFVVCDGESIVASRYSSQGDDGASLHYVSGRELRCQEGLYEHEPGDETDFVLVASEETTPGFCWQVVPDNHLLIASRTGAARLMPIVLP